MTTETTFFDSGNIAVTNARFVVGAQTFAIRGITSVEGVELPRNYTAPAVVMLFGVITAMFTIAGGLVAALFGTLAVLLLASGIRWAWRQKPTYAVVLHTAGGEVMAYQSADRTHVSQIIQALSESIISNG